MENFSNEAYFDFFLTLASRTRLAIIDVLNAGPKTPYEISEELKQEDEIVLLNLKQLENCYLIHSEDKVENKRYSLNKEILEPLSELLNFHINKHCPGLKECISQEKLKEYLKEEAAKPLYIQHE